MKNCYKKALFALTGLAIIGAGFFYGKHNTVEAGVKEGQRFEDWEVACPMQDNKKICFLTQSVTSTKGSKRDILVIYQIGYFGKHNKLSMYQLVPPNIQIEPGAIIIASETNLIAPSKYVSCNPTLCSAFTEISDSDLETLLASPTPQFSYTSNTGQVKWPISTKGLKEGLVALKK